jgi:hypothetical protein
MNAVDRPSDRPRGAQSGRRDSNPGPPAPKAENQRSPALMGADFDDSALSVAHQR